MNYPNDLSGRIASDASDTGSVADPRDDHRRGALLSFGDVEERLIEAMRICWRNPDRERGWQTLRSAWPDVLRELSAGDYDARGGEHTSSDVAIRPASLTRAEVADMEEAFGWMDSVDPDDRKLIGLAITAMARGLSQVPWRAFRQDRAKWKSADGLRMRYERAMGALCRSINGGNLNPSAVKP